MGAGGGRRGAGGAGAFGIGDREERKRPQRHKGTKERGKARAWGLLVDGGSAARKDERGHRGTETRRSNARETQIRRRGGWCRPGLVLRVFMAVGLGGVGACCGAGGRAGGGVARRMAGGGTGGCAAGVRRWRGELAGLPKLDHGFQAGENAGEAGHDEGVDGIRQPQGHVLRLRRLAQGGELGRQGGLLN